MPKNYKAQALFSQLLYLANLKDSIFQNEVQNIFNDRGDLQKYFLATSNLSDSIQESLDLVVINGRLKGGTAVSHESDLNPTTNFFEQNNNALDAVYRKQAKFDVQYLITESLSE